MKTQNEMSTRSKKSGWQKFKDDWHVYLVVTIYFGAIFLVLNMFGIDFGIILLPEYPEEVVIAKDTTNISDDAVKLPAQTVAQPVAQPEEKVLPVVKKPVKESPKEELVRVALSPTSEIYSLSGQELITREDFILYGVKTHEFNKQKVFYLQPRLAFENEKLGERRLELSEFPPATHKWSYIQTKVLLSHHYLTVVHYLPSGSRLMVTYPNDLTYYNWDDRFNIISDIKYLVWLGDKMYLVTKHEKILSPR